jgi:predicted dehydrogenase
MKLQRIGLSRRSFMKQTGSTALAASVVYEPVLQADVPDNPLQSDRQIKMGIVGGGFGTSFQWHEHPNCIVHAVSDLRKDRRDQLIKVYKCDRTYESLEKLILDPEIDAVAVFTGAPDHVRHCIMVMEAGKHVISAVPAAMSIEECEQLLEAKKRTGRTYMMAETSWYRYYTIAARELYRQGKFGDLYYSEVEYYHPHDEASHLRAVRQDKRTWRYGLPPMLYPTHSTGFLVGVTGERYTDVSSLGYGIKGSQYLRNRDNAYKNPFSSQTGTFKTNRSHMSRVNVFWDGIAHGERAQWFGTDLAFYMPGSGGQPFKIQGEGAPDWSVVPNYWERLPKALRHNSGHGGSHTFITHEFISALVEDREPTVNIHEALALTAPGIIAYQSALKKGEQMKVPDFDS